MVINPEEWLTSEEKAFEVEMSVSGGGATIYKTNSDFSTWTQVDNVQMDNGVAHFAPRRVEYMWLWPTLFFYIFEIPS